MYSTLISSFSLASRWNLELCVDKDHFVLKLLLHLVQSCLDNLDECLDAVWRFKAAIVCSLRPQTGQLIGPSGISMISSKHRKKKEIVQWKRMQDKVQTWILLVFFLEIKTIYNSPKIQIFCSRENKYH